MPKIDGVALGTIGAGALLLYAGVTNKDILSVIQGTIKGSKPSTASTQAAGVIEGTPQSALNTTVAVATGATGTGQAPGTTTAAGRGSGGGGTPAGGTLSNAQIQALWISAGGNKAKAATAACIAEHESSGRTSVTSPNPDGGTNVGLWQLDTPGGKGAGYSVAQLQNPLTNARVAIKGSSNGTDWSAWATAGDCGV